MKKFFFVSLAALWVAGCSTVSIPGYIKDENPYKRKIYADFDQTLKATSESFEELGWTIERASEPSIFEHDTKPRDKNVRQTLLFTEVHELALVVGTRYSRMNIYLRQASEKTTDIEIRYVTVTSVPAYNFYGYQNDNLIDSIFKKIENKLAS